ncbi:transposable element Tcb2 transposase [Trichonephila clavipes]|nr:transposable element Tcb2 transposase [Trichonephila clavipes]
MSERGETDSRSIGSSDKFRTTAVRRSVVNHQTRGMMAQRRQLDMFTKGGIVGMLESSRSQTEVSRILNVDQSVISRLWQMFQRARNVTRQSASGRPRVTTPRQDRYLVISVRRQRGSTARALGSALTVAKGIRISRQTVYMRLNHAGLYSRRPAVYIPFTSAHKRARLNWGLKHQHRGVGEWVNVMFSDESQFSLRSDSRRVTIWRERGTRFEPRNITERHHFPSRRLMVWTGIMMDGRTGLHFFDTGSVTAQRYRDEVLEPYVRLFRGAVGPDFIFMDDNAPCHRAELIDDFLETENIQRISWPANSPDLNPIEHVWDMLGRKIAALSHPPSSVTELKRALQEAWNRLIPQLIHHLIASMSHGKIGEVEIGGVAIYRPFGEFHRANSYCHLLVPCRGGRCTLNTRMSRLKRPPVGVMKLGEWVPAQVSSSSLDHSLKLRGPLPIANVQLK